MDFVGAHSAPAERPRTALAGRSGGADPFCVRFWRCAALMSNQGDDVLQQKGWVPHHRRIRKLEKSETDQRGQKPAPPQSAARSGVEAANA